MISPASSAALLAPFTTSRLVSAAPSSGGAGLWTPTNGPSGLLVVARSRPLAVVIGGRVLETTDGNTADDAAQSSNGGGRRTTVTLGGLVVISGSTARQSEPTRIVGHPDLASGTSVRHRDTLYVSVSEAIYREGQGEDVELHLQPTPEDDEALAGVRQRARRRWEGDHLPDGWTRPLPAAPNPDGGRGVSRKSGELPDELRALADRFRSKAENGSGDDLPA